MVTPRDAQWGGVLCPQRTLKECGGPGSGRPGPCPQNRPHIKTAATSRSKASQASKELAKAEAAHAKKPTPDSRKRVAEFRAKSKAAESEAVKYEGQAAKAEAARVKKDKGGVLSKVGAGKAKSRPSPVAKSEPVKPKPTGKPKAPTTKADDLAKPYSHSDLTDEMRKAGVDPAKPWATHDNPEPLGIAKIPVDAAKEKAVRADVLKRAQDQQATSPFKRQTIADLYNSVGKDAGLSVREFQAVLLRGQQSGELRLGPYTQALSTHPEPRFLFPADREPKWYVEPGATPTGGNQGQKPADQARYEKLKAERDGAKDKPAAKAKAQPDSPSKPAAQAASFQSKDDSEAWGKKHFAEWGKSLDTSEKKAIKTYFSKDYAAINSQLKLGNVDPKFTSTVAGLDSTISKGTVPEDIKVYRGIKSTAIFGDPASMVGKTIEHKGFLSTSTLRSIGDRFASLEGSKDVAVLEMVVPKGTKAAFMPRAMRDDFGEQELLLGRGHKMKVVGVRMENGKRVIQVELA